MTVQHRISGRQVAAYVADLYGITWEVFASQQSRIKLAHARQVAMYAIRQLCPHISLSQAGRIMGGRDHTTILHGVQRVEMLMNTDTSVAEGVGAILEHFRNLPPHPTDLMLSAQIDATTKYLEVLIRRAQAQVRVSHQLAMSA